MTPEINITSISLVFLLLSLNAINAKNICTNSQATCINIRRCPYIIEIAREQREPLPLETVETIRKSRCGTEGDDPMVCCILQNTTSGLTMITDSLSEANDEEENDISDPPDVTKHPNLRLLDHQACGPFIPQNFLGTSIARIFDYPWMALLVYNVKKGQRFLCSGSIISSRYILTAAHCIYIANDKIRVIGVRVGIRNVNKEHDCDTDLDGHEVLCSERYQDFGIESIHLHPDYNEYIFHNNNLYNDIGLIRLNRTIDFTPLNVKPICLPFGSAAIPNQRTATVTGWRLKTGQIWTDNPIENLLHVKLPLLSNDKCKEAYKNYNYTIKIWYKQICAGGLITGSCQGHPVIGIKIGDRNINKLRDCDIDLDGHEVQCSEKYQEFGIESMHPHPDYNTSNYHNDIGLIRLNDTIDFSPFSVKPICLPFGSAAMLNQRTATVTGWGHKTLHSAYDFDFELSPSLLHAKLPLVSNDKCKEIYKNISEIWYKQICAGGLTMDACLGDAGGPLQAPGMYNGTVRTIQYGIVSSGLGPCGIVGYPGVYTKVSYYMDWILDIMRD